MGKFDGWRNIDPSALAQLTAATARPKSVPAGTPPRTRWTAKPCIITIDGTIYELAIAKKLNLVGIRCGSLHEAKRVKELMLEQKAGLITDLMLQRRFTLSYPSSTGPIVLGDYIADATYMRNGVFVVEDAKGMPGRSQIYQWKKKHMRAQHGIEILET